MRNIFHSIVIIFFVSANLFAQDSLLVGRKYFEDQLYIGVTYNILTNKPADLQQIGLSTDYHIGFIKEFPLNNKGTTALGLGVGYSYNQYSQNLLIQNQTPEFTIIENEDYKNKFETHAVEFPIEIRVYRSSSPTIYKFFRIYLGGKISYVFRSKSFYSSAEENIKLRPLPYVNKWQYGPYLAIGWGPWNLYTYYNANNLFSKAPISETINPNDLRNLKIGLQFYIF